VDSDFPVQDTCYRTLDESAVNFSANPLFTYATDLLQFDAFLTQLSLRDFTLEGSIGPDSMSLGGITFKVILDVREVTEMMGVDNYSEVCTLAGNVGTECMPCPHDDSVEACIEIQGTGMSATLVGGGLVDIAEENTHEDCEKTEDE
jgi:hypothetical protein